MIARITENIIQFLIRRLVRRRLLYVDNYITP